MKKVLFSWSGGKDSALALYEIQKDPAYEVVALLTTVTEDYDRVSMHGFRTELLVAQAASLSLPLKQIKISKDATNDDYENRMRESLTQFQNDGVLSVVFGDIFLEDLKKYREDKLAQVDMGAIFPLWKKDTKELANKFINTGFKALITCVDTNVLDARFTGRDYDTDLLNDLPAGVD
ncbi:MAG TPA: ATP-binding protein, partial [Actinobacteria bacterium]|nr:ATP-binding protein [Actinomycetota bacterium]